MRKTSQALWLPGRPARRPSASSGPDERSFLRGQVLQPFCSNRGRDLMTPLELAEGHVVAELSQRRDDQPAAPVDWQDLISAAVRNVEPRLPLPRPVDDESR